MPGKENALKVVTIKAACLCIAVFIAAFSLFSPFFPSPKTSAHLQRAVFAKDSSKRTLEAYKAIDEGQKVLAAYASFPAAVNVAMAYQIVGRPAYAKAFFLYAQSLYPHGMGVRKEVEKLNQKLKLPPSSFRFYSSRELFAASLLLAAAFLFYKRQDLSDMRKRFIFCSHVFLLFACFGLSLYELFGRETIAVVLEPTRETQLLLSENGGQRADFFLPGQEIQIIDSEKHAFLGYLVQKGSSLLRVPASSVFVLPE